MYRSHIFSFILLGPLRVFSTSLVHLWALPETISTCISQGLLSYNNVEKKHGPTPDVLLTWGWNFRMHFRQQGVHGSGFNPMKISYWFMYTIFVKTQPVASYQGSRALCWGFPSGLLLDPRFFLSVMVGSALALILLMFLQGSIYNWAQLRWSRASSVCFWKSHPSQDPLTPGVSLGLPCALTWLQLRKSNPLHQPQPWSWRRGNIHHCSPLISAQRALY